MLIEIIIYIALFSLLFCGAFSTIFQSIDALQYLRNKGEVFDTQLFLAGRLDAEVNKNSNWNSVISDFSGNSHVTISSPSAEIIESPTSSTKVLDISLTVNGDNYTYSYVQEK